MTTSTLLSISNISLGAIILMVSIYKHYSTLNIAQSLNVGSKKSADTIWYKLHYFLMVFFLLGYLIAIISLLKDVNIVGEIFVSLIFLFGAAFVLIGILLQKKLTSSITNQNNELLDQNSRLSQVQDANIYSLAYLAEIRDTETGKHLERTSLYVKELSFQLLKSKQYEGHLTSKYIEDLVKSAPLHDIGKVGIEDSILNKEGKLTDMEFKAIQLHCEYGANILREADKKIDFQSYLSLAIPLVRSHHERWDGSGYPDGLKGDQIPLSARIMAIADVYDALRSDRCYKKGFPHKKSVEIIKLGRETHFSPETVDAFLQIEAKFEEISNTLADKVKS